MIIHAWALAWYRKNQFRVAFAMYYGRLDSFDDLFSLLSPVKSNVQKEARWHPKSLPSRGASIESAVVSASPFRSGFWTHICMNTYVQCASVCECVCVCVCAHAYMELRICAYIWRYTFQVRVSHNKQNSSNGKSKTEGRLNSKEMPDIQMSTWHRGPIYIWRWE